MSQVSVPKLSAYVMHGPPDDSIMVPKLSIYVWLEPGNDGGDDSGQTRQGYCYTQTIRRN